MKQIVYWDRSNKREEIEQVYGDKLVRWLYGTVPGQKLADWFLSRSLPSKVYGSLQSSRLSRPKIERFIRTFQIPMDQYESKPFDSFNDFFVRKFRAGARTFVSDPGAMPAFAEARYLAYEKISNDQTFPVKGSSLSPAMLLGGHEKAAPFVGGSVLIARLCPTDYHRFHYPDAGETIEDYPIHGKFHSVNPIALRYKSEIFITNERHVSILKTENFGRIAYIEVGALCVGRIVQSHSATVPFQRGDEKGYFLFGGSTVIVLGEPGAWVPEADLLEQTGRQRETLVRLGDQIAHR